MTKQEEIREGIAKELYWNYHTEITNRESYWRQMSERVRQHWLEEADQILIYLHSQGVVIKVERELPDYYNAPTVFSRDRDKQHAFVEGCRYMLKTGNAKAGCVAVKPLIKEVNYD